MTHFIHNIPEEDWKTFIFFSVEANYFFLSCLFFRFCLLGVSKNSESPNNQKNSTHCHRYHNLRGLCLRTSGLRSGESTHPLWKHDQERFFSASVVDIETVRCFLLDHETNAPPIKKQYPVTDFWSFGSPAKLLLA